MEAGSTKRKKEERTMKPQWEKYCEDVENGKIVTGKSIKEAVARFRDFQRRDDIYFDKKAVEDCIFFISQIKHFLGKFAGTNFVLQNWQCLILASVFGWKWKATGLRVTNEVYIQIARKAGKDALIAAICLYCLVAEGEAAPEIIAASNSVNQSRILFDYIINFAKSLDGTKKVLVPYRNYLKMPATNGVVSVISSDPSKADGKNISVFCLDEFHEARDRRMYDVLKSSQAMRQNPLAIIITTAGFNLDGPCHDMYELAIQVLAGVKTMDNFQAFIFELDEEDDWKDPKNFIKCQPNLGVTVTEEFMLEEVHKAEIDSTAVTGVLTKTFNKWVQNKVFWIPQELIARLMSPVNLEDYRGRSIILGADLSTVSDFSSISVLIPPSEEDDKFVFKSYCFLPEATLNNHPNKVLYEKFIREGTMIRTPSNVLDYDFILHKIWEINQICPISAIYMDTWNATQFQTTATDAGYNVQPFSQAVGNYNACTKEFERLAKEGKMIIDRSACVLFQFGNVFLKGDINGNVKPSKESVNKKIDSVIAMTTALGGYLKNPISNDFDIYVI